jgi:hypothetical protein
MERPLKVNGFKALYATQRLEEAIRELEIFMDPKNEECDVRGDARGEGTQLYLGSWVLGPMKEALRLLEGRDPE